MNGMMWDSGLGYGYMGLGLIFWILIIAGVIMLIKSLTDQSKMAGGVQQMSAMEHLKIRYAKGEITNDEFEEMKKRLM